MQTSGTPPARDAVLRARSLIGTGRYLVDAGGRDPHASTPDGIVRGRRGCDYAGFLAWCFGYDRYQRGFAYGWDWINADSMIAEAETLARPTPSPGLAARRGRAHRTGLENALLSLRSCGVTMNAQHLRLQERTIR